MQSDQMGVRRFRAVVHKSSFLHLNQSNSTSVQGQKRKTHFEQMFSASLPTPDITQRFNVPPVLRTERLSEFELALIQPTPEQLMPEPEPVRVHHVRAAVTLFNIGQNLTFAGDRCSRSLRPSRIDVKVGRFGKLSPLQPVKTSFLQAAQSRP